MNLVEKKNYTVRLKSFKTLQCGQSFYKVAFKFLYLIGFLTEVCPSLIQPEDENTPVWKSVIKGAKGNLKVS